MHVALQTHRDVKELSQIARKAKLIAQMAAEKMKEQAQQMAQNVQEQRTQLLLQVQASQVEQETIA